MNEGERYCLHDYQVLYAPECKQCGEFVRGEVVKVFHKSPAPAQLDILKQKRFNNRKKVFLGKKLKYKSVKL
jgi:hypothetical protein